MDPDFDSPPPSSSRSPLGWLILAIFPAAGIAVIWASHGFAVPGLPDIGMPWLAAGFIWLGLAGLTSWLADKRGYPPGTWFALGLLFGLGALIAVGLAPIQERD